MDAIKVNFRELINAITDTSEPTPLQELWKKRFKKVLTISGNMLFAVIIFLIFVVIVANLFNYILQPTIRATLWKEFNKNPLRNAYWLIIIALEIFAFLFLFIAALVKIKKYVRLYDLAKLLTIVEIVRLVVIYSAAPPVAQTTDVRPKTYVQQLFEAAKTSFRF